MDNPIVIALGLLVIGVVLFWIGSLVTKANLYDEFKPRIDGLKPVLDGIEIREALFKNEQLEWTEKVQTEKESNRKLALEFERRREEIEALAREKSTGFPWLAQAYADYFYLRDLAIADDLESKSRPAKRAAEQVREIAVAKKTAEKARRILEYQLRYYESLFPWLADFKGEELDDLIQQATAQKIETTTEFDEGEVDPAKQWLTETEYSTLSTSEKYQLALDRYWKRQKTKWVLGRDYERFIGYQYETHGWQVQYQGIIERFEDLGRDLIVTKGNDVQIIQCKYWSRDKVIHEKHLFQLYGTSVAYQIDHPDKNVNALFVTSTVLSDRAKQFADVLKVNSREKKPLERYPCVKCNISWNGNKIYHLPFDQQYDNTIIELANGERYVETVKEAEELGFRRAFKWHGANSNGI